MEYKGYAKGSGWSRASLHAEEEVGRCIGVGLA